MLAKKRIALPTTARTRQIVQTMAVMRKMINAQVMTSRVAIANYPTAQTLPSISSSAANAGERMIRENAEA